MATLSQIQSDDEVAESTVLTVVPRQVVSTIIAADDTDILGRLAAKVRDFRPDVSTPKGRRAIASLADEVATSKMDLVRLANGLMEADRKRITGILAERKIIEDRMNELKAQVRQQLTDFENADKARIKGHEDALAALAVHPSMERASSEELSAAIQVRLEPEARNWQEFHQRALTAQDQAIAILRGWRAAAAEREEAEEGAERRRAEEAERSRLAAIQAQQEREARIAAEAAAAARRAAEERGARDAEEVAAAARLREQEIERQAQAARAAEAVERARAERAEADRLAAERRAEQAKIAAEKQGELDRVRAIDDERRRAEREAAAVQEAEKKRAADIEHRRKINGEALVDVHDLIGDMAIARAVVVAISRSAVRHISIKY